MYESSPATNGIRAEPASHADPIPAIDTLSKNANGATIHTAPTRAAMWLTASTIPCSTLMSCLPTATSSVSVAPIYNNPDNTPPHATAPGKTRCGFSISSPITDASSSPTRPKQITPNEFSTNRGFAGMEKSAAVTLAPKRTHTIAPSPISTAAATNVPIAPRLLIHFPTPSPTTFSTTSSVSRINDALSANTLLSPKAWCPPPRTNTDTPTKYSITVGTYIMFLVQ